MLKIKEGWLFLISGWTGIFTVLKSDLKNVFLQKKICFFAGLDSQPNGWYVKVRQAFQVPLQSGLATSRGSKDLECKRRNLKPRRWEGV